VIATEMGLLHPYNFKINVRSECVPCALPIPLRNLQPPVTTLILLLDANEQPGLALPPQILDHPAHPTPPPQLHPALHLLPQLHQTPLLRPVTLRPKPLPPPAILVLPAVQLPLPILRPQRNPHQLSVHPDCRQLRRGYVREEDTGGVSGAAGAGWDRM
jgi:hypothetical protein